MDVILYLSNLVKLTTKYDTALRRLFSSLKLARWVRKNTTLYRACHVPTSLQEVYNPNNVYGSNMSIFACVTIISNKQICPVFIPKTGKYTMLTPTKILDSLFDNKSCISHFLQEWPTAGEKKLIHLCTFSRNNKVNFKFQVQENPLVFPY